MTLGPRRRFVALPTWVATAALVLVPSHPLWAQAAAPVLEPGACVRLTFPCEPPTPGPCRFVGTFVQVTGDTIALTLRDSAARYDLAAVHRLEVARGRRSHWLVGAGAGLLVGAGVTFAVLNSGGSTSLCNRSANQDALATMECAGLTALGGLAGGGLGTLVGGLIRSERREDVPLERLRAGDRGPP